MNPRLLIILLAVLLALLGAIGAYVAGFLAGIRAVLWPLLRLGLALIITVAILALLLLGGRRAREV